MGTKRKWLSALAGALVILTFLTVVACEAPISGISTSAEIEKAACLPGWSLVWSDEFNGYGRPNPSNWNYDVGNGYNMGVPGFLGWGNNEMEWYRPENCFQQNGHLVIRASYSPTPVYSAGGRDWNITSGRITSHGKVSVKYGRIEARVKLPKADSNWAAFWMMGTSEDGTYTSSYHPASDYYDKMAGDWSSCGEIDIMEHINGGDLGFNNVLWDTRVGVYPWAPDTNASAAKNVPYGDVGQYHVYAIEWDANSIKWFVDGVQTHSVDTTAASMEEFRKPFYLIFNMAIGGNLPGKTPNIADFPLSMYVDYVRVYKKS